MNEKTLIVFYLQAVVGFAQIKHLWRCLFETLHQIEMSGNIVSVLLLEYIAVQFLGVRIKSEQTTGNDSKLSRSLMFHRINRQIMTCNSQRFLMLGVPSVTK